MIGFATLALLWGSASIAKALVVSEGPAVTGNATVTRAEKVARADGESRKDEAALEQAPLGRDEYREAAEGAGVMQRKDNDDGGEACGTAYCDDLVHYKPELMHESQFLDQCAAAHREWEHATDYSLECPHKAQDDCGGVECPINANARRHQQLLDLLEHTRHLIDKRRAKEAQRQAHVYAADSASEKKAKAAQDADVAAGQKQRRMAKVLQASIDVRAYQREKRSSMKVKTRCKNGNVVGNVYAKNDDGAPQKRSPDCTEMPVHTADTIPEQGYLRTQKPGQ